MRFEERELKPFAEPVPVSKLTQGSVYFSVGYIDDQLLMPTVEPLVYIGENLDAGDVGHVSYFQDASSYRQGIRHDSPSKEGKATFLTASEGKMPPIFEYESALNELLTCALRRRKIAEDGPAWET
jgi:hypothetical protein